MSSEVWERHSNEIVETLRRAVEDANMSIDELVALSGVDRAEVTSVLVGGTKVAPGTSALLAATLSSRIAEQARQNILREAMRMESHSRKRLAAR